MRILVAEDNKAVSLVICKIIEQCGHDYCLAADGEQALTMLQEREIDLLFLDIEMPLIDGYTVATILREQDSERSTWTPIVFISGRTDNKSLNRGLIAGADDYIFKPVNRLLLEAKIHLFARLQESRESKQVT